MEKITRGSLKVGTKVIYRPNFGRDEQVVATIVSVNRSKYKDFKINTKLVDSIPFSKRKYCVIDYDNGKWGYGSCIDAIVKD